MAEFTDHQRLRALLGETVGGDVTESDTLFTNDQIEDLLARHGSVEAALEEGWGLKAAALATLVDTVEGSTQRRLSDAHEHALNMAKYYDSTGAGSNSGVGSRTTIRKISRRGL